jgi:hypothetical protein
LTAFKRAGTSGAVPAEPIAFDIDLSDAERQSLQNLSASPADALPRLARVALREWLAWLGADDRPASMTEAAKRRTKALLDERLLPEAPTAAIVAQRVRLTLGQARYIVSALALENPGGGEAVRVGLVAALSAALSDEGVADPEHLDAAAIGRLRGATALSFDAQRGIGDLAKATHEELLNEEFARSPRFDISNFDPPTITRRTEGFVHIEVAQHVAVAILQRLSRPRT